MHCLREPGIPIFEVANGWSPTTVAVALVAVMVGDATTYMREGSTWNARPGPGPFEVLAEMTKIGSSDTGTSVKVQLRLEVTHCWTSPDGPTASGLYGPVGMRNAVYEPVGTTPLGIFVLRGGDHENWSEVEVNRLAKLVIVG